jgi:FAD/FMN-containing dehydrogenase
MRGVRVDPAARTVRAEGGAGWGDFDHATAAFGLATTGGVVSTTGIGGLTLGGGIGWLQGKYGLTCDNLLSVDVVTADARFVKASETENPDLFWGIRGGGGNFGIVTSFEYRLHPIGERILAGALLYPGEKARELLLAYGQWAEVEPDEITSFMVFLTAPSWPTLPERLHGKPMVGLGAAHCGTLAEAEKALAPLRELAEPVLDLIAPVPYTTLQRMSDDDWRPGLLNYWKPEFLQPMSEALADTIVEHTGRFVAPVLDDRPTDVIAAQPVNCFEIGHMGGATRRIGEMDTAYSRRDADYLVNITSVWTREEESERMVAWARDFSQALRPFSAGGGYVNYFVSDDGEERVKATYGPEKYGRLARLKAKYDPANFFSLNPNIKPAAGADAYRESG